MKKTLPFFLSAFLVSCAGENAVQMSITDAQLVKIDTIQRYPNNSEKLLTWRTTDNINYVTFAPIEEYYPLGTRIKVMVKR